jgi:hypothetical protein
MSLTIYGFTSKAYPFGNPPGGTPPANFPTKMFSTAQYAVGLGERVVIKVTLGGKSGGGYVWKTLLDITNTAGTLVQNTPTLLDKEISVTDIAPSVKADWVLAVKAEIHADSTTPPPFGFTEPLRLYTYRNNALGINQVFLNNPPPHPESTVGAILSGASQRAHNLQSLNHMLTPLNGVQVQLKAKGTPVVFRTVVTNAQGFVETTLPPGSYDVFFTGQGFRPNDALIGTKAVTVGVSDTVTRFAGDLNTVASNAEFAVIKDRMASTRWIGYMVPEDFTESRRAYWNPAVDTAYTGTDTRLYTNFADLYFGRLFRGNSFIEYIGIGTDPARLEGE